MLLTVRRLLTIAVIACAACAMLAGPAAARMTWSEATALDTSGGVPLTRVACASSAQCVAIDGDGRYVSFARSTGRASNPRVLVSGGIASGLTCPAVSDCIALFQDGQVIAFDPSLGSAATPLDEDPSATQGAQGALGLACPSAGECVLVDGTGNVVVFNPGDSAAAAKPVPLLPSAGFGLLAIVCESVTQCTAISQTQALEFDPQALGQPGTGGTTTTATTPQVATIEPKGLLDALACPTSTQCVAADQLGRVVSFDPQTLTATAPVRLDTELQDALVAISCPAAAGCVAISQGGKLIEFDPATVVTAGATATQTLTGTEGLNALTCPSAASCVAVDSAGQEIPFSALRHVWPPLKRIDSGTPLGAIACASASQCTALDSAREMTFDPLDVSHGSFRAVRTGALADIGAIACPTVKLCDATRGGMSLAFDPEQFREPAQHAVDDNAGDEIIVAMRCRGATECVAIGSDGGGVSYDPLTGRRIFKQRINVEEGEALTALACPSRTQCTALDNDGMMISFQPLTGRTIAEAKIDARVGLDAPSGDSDNELDGVACVSTTRCIAIDTLGDAVAFNPRSSRGMTPKVVDASQSLTAIACPSSVLCIAVDDAGRVLTGNLRTGGWTAQALSGASALTAIACAGTGECVITDAAGRAFVGVSRRQP